MVSVQMVSVHMISVQMVSVQFSDEQCHCFISGINKIMTIMEADLGNVQHNKKHSPFF